MHVLIVFDHPYGAAASSNEPRNRSFSAALLRATLAGLTAAGHSADTIDLAADNFDPRMSRADLVAWRHDRATDPLVLDYQARLAAADHLVLIHPLWWMTPPATTKGFIDRVLTPGFSFFEPRPGAALERRLHRLGAVTVLSAYDTPPALWKTWFGQPSARALGRGTFQLIGIKRFRWWGFAATSRKSLQQRERILARVERRFSRL